MKVRSLIYDDEQLPATLTVEMTIGEARAIFAIACNFNGYAERKLGLTGDESLYDAFSQLFCALWHDGRPPSTPNIDLASINEP